MQRELLKESLQPPDTVISLRGIKSVSGHKFFFLSAVLLSLGCYGWIGYELHRENFTQLAAASALLFTSYLFIVLRRATINFSYLIAAAILFRLVFLFSIPALSDDYFRFIWDGKMISLFHNPYTVLPSTFVRHSKQVNEMVEQLFSAMNSANYYTVYPPVCQFIFAASAWVGSSNIFDAVVIIRIICLGTDLGSIILIQKLLNQLGLPEKNLFWYALNPLVIIELCGNLHFESIMIFFMLLAIFLFWKKKIVFSAIAYGLAISTKIIPLLFLPFLIRRLRWQSTVYFSITAVTCAILFLPFLDQALFINLASSIDLYFRKFEFNASIYYLIRWLGLQAVGYNIINQAGPLLALGVFISVIILAMNEKKLTIQNFFVMMQWSLTIYLALATTVHPWYIVPLVMMSVFTGYRYPVVWSLMIALTYATYQTQENKENLWLTATEYFSVLIFLGVEFRDKFFMVLRNKESSTKLKE
ncbi:MAG: glycosyltransferase family 87 protein [Chitinophagales bacterium]